MLYSEFQFIFNRSFEHAFSRSKLFLTFLILAASGVFIVFSRGLADSASPWVVMSLTFLPVFLLSGVLLALGVVLIRSYHDEIKKKKVEFSRILTHSLDVMLGSAYFTVPVILLYLILWMLLGIFLLLRNIPALGDFIAVVLAFAPFLINLATLLLCVFVIATLFFVTPVIALKGLSRSSVALVLGERLKGDLFTNLLLFIVAILPFSLTFLLLLTSAIMTGSLCAVCDETLYRAMQWFFIMIPFAFLLSPSIIFFFNFSAEAHVLMQKRLGNSRG